MTTQTYSPQPDHQYPTGATAHSDLLKGRHAVPSTSLVGRTDQQTTQQQRSTLPEPATYEGRRQFCRRCGRNAFYVTGDVTGTRYCRPEGHRIACNACGADWVGDHDCEGSHWEFL